MRRLIISFFLILFVCARGKTQAGLKDTLNFKISPPVIKSLRTDNTPFSKYMLSVARFPQNYYASYLGFFCKKELLLQRKVGLPVKIRMGSVAYTDALEGKGFGSKPQMARD